MIGTGVFTSLGFQLLEIRSPFALLLLWGVGGITALCGALSYAELGAALPRSGGEYNFLTRIYHPGAGFISGWVSATVGFAAPTALAALTFSSYLSSVFPVLSPVWLASALIIALTIFHCRSHRSSGLTQSFFNCDQAAADTRLLHPRTGTGGQPGTCEFHTRQRRRGNPDWWCLRGRADLCKLRLLGLERCNLYQW